MTWPPSTGVPPAGGMFGMRVYVRSDITVYPEQTPFTDSNIGLDHGVGHAPVASGPRHNTSAPEANACEDPDVRLRGHSMAATVSEAHALFP
jgi:hypothetical protein